MTKLSSGRLSERLSALFVLFAFVSFVPAQSDEAKLIVERNGPNLLAAKEFVDFDFAFIALTNAGPYKAGGKEYVIKTADQVAASGINISEQGKQQASNGTSRQAILFPAGYAPW
jgi:hypothetical protein